MKPFDFLLMCLICFAWGLNIVATRWIVSDLGVPPLGFAAMRFCLVALLLSPFLLPRPRDMRRMFFIAMGMGAAHLGLMFMGLARSSAGTVAIVSQLGVPFSTLLSVMMLGERIRWRRALGMVLAFAGAVLVSWPDGGANAALVGPALVAASALAGSVAAVMMKRIDPMPALRMQGWIALLSAPLLALASFSVESGQVAAIMAGGWALAGVTAFAVLVVSILAHGSFYLLLRRYEVTLLSPLTLMTPLWGLALGVAMLGETATAASWIGSILTLAGVGIVTVRPNRTSPLAGFGRKLFQ